MKRDDVTGIVDSYNTENGGELQHNEVNISQKDEHYVKDPIRADEHMQ